MNRILIVALLQLFIVGVAMGQEKHVVDETQFRRALNNAFNKLVSSNPNAGEIANYITIDPVNASFGAKSNIPIQPGRRKRLKKLDFEDKLKDDPAKISYLSLSASGSLLDNKIGTLFTNSSLNSGVSIGAQYHFWIGKAKFSYFRRDRINFELKRDLLFRKYNESKIQIESRFTLGETVSAKRLIELNKISANTKLQKNKRELALVQKTVDSLGAAIRSRTGLVDTLQKMLQDVAGLQKSYDAVHMSLDSINAINNRNIGDLRNIEIDKLRAKLKKDYESLAGEMNFQKLRLFWISVIVDYSRKSYNTFDASLPFVSQLDKDKLDAVSRGLAINHLIQDSLKRRTWFFNVSGTRSRKNNLATLSTTTVEEKKEIRNQQGDIIRTITSKTAAYTDPINTYKTWNLTAHGYYIFGKSPTGIHLSPSFDFRDHSHTISYLTLGCVIPFQNTAKDQPVINAEIYVRFNDVFNEENDDSKFYNRNEIGISLTLPFKIF